MIYLHMILLWVAIDKLQWVVIMDYNITSGVG